MMPIFVIAKFFWPAFAAAQGTACSLPNNTFFFLPHWWEYLPTQIDDLGHCSPVFNFPSDIWVVGLSVLDMLLRLGGFIAVISIIVAGIQYITAMGSPEKGVSARKRLTNSLIGLAILLIASATVGFIGNRIGG